MCHIMYMCILRSSFITKYCTKYFVIFLYQRQCLKSTILIEFIGQIVPFVEVIIVSIFINFLLNIVTGMYIKST